MNMTTDNEISVVHMSVGESGVVIKVNGGQGLVNRLASLGIRPGRRITKVSAMFLHGPITVEVDRVQLAIGYGMARRIIVGTKGLAPEAAR
jgi:ferrous iron transport protein A